MTKDEAKRAGGKWLNENDPDTDDCVEAMKILGIELGTIVEDWFLCGVDEAFHASEAARHSI